MSDVRASELKSMKTNNECIQEMWRESKLLKQIALHNPCALRKYWVINCVFSTDALEC